MASRTTHLNFINGEFLESRSSKTLTKTDPSSGETVADVVDSDLMDVVLAIQAGNKALAAWTKSTADQRASVLNTLADLIEAHANAFATAIARDIGTPVSQTLKFSVPQAARAFRNHAKHLTEKPVSAAADLTSLTVRSPVGLVAVITPASDPLVCLASRVAPALAGGNAVIVKVSRQTPECGSLFAQLISKSTVPVGVFALLQGRGEVVGEALVQHPGISTISFLGSTETGRRVNLAAAENLKRIHLSLGAKNPVLLFANVDLKSVISNVAAVCLGLFPSRSLQGARLFIQESIFKETLDLLKKEFDAVKVGSPLEISTQLGPLPTAQAATRFREAVVLAKKENGRMVTTKADAQTLLGHFVQPILFADLTNCSTLQQDEILGPLVLASSFKYQHEALKHANVSPYGRVGYIFESDPEKAKLVASRIEAGQVFINLSEPQLNMFSQRFLWKNSGSGDEGEAALATFFCRESVVANTFA